jgi:hypothetical protein
VSLSNSQLKRESFAHANHILNIKFSDDRTKWIFVQNVRVFSYFCCFAMPRRREEKKAPIKGEEIRFIRGTYKGLTGWSDTANKSKKKSKMIWVVVKDEDYDEEIHTKVWRTSIREMQKVPTTWAQAAVQQHQEIEDAVIEVARLFASCSIADETSVIELIGKEIRRAQTENRKQTKQTVRVVQFDV